MIVSDFINKHKLNPDFYDEDFIIDNLLVEIKKGLESYYDLSKCSIPMLPAYINRDIDTNNKEYIVIDAGGTNFRSGIAKYDNGEVVISNFAQTVMPGTERELNRTEFFSQVYENIKNISNNNYGIGFCFSYQLKMMKNLSGTLQAWAKEIKAKEVVGLDIGKELTTFIKNANNTEHDIAIINDTIAVLLGSFANNLEYDKLIGCIYGTGFNVCYEEETKNISKVQDYFEDRMIINTEVGNFNKIIKGDIDEEFNAMTSLPSEAQAEKLISGTYLSKLVRFVLLKAEEEQVISKTNIDYKLKMKDISAFLDGGDSIISTLYPNDYDTIHEIIITILKRAAKVAAAIIASFAIKSNVKKVGIILEGTTIYKTPHLMDYLKSYLTSMLEKRNIEYGIIDGRDKVLHGALFSIMKKG